MITSFDNATAASQERSVKAAFHHGIIGGGPSRFERGTAAYRAWVEGRKLALYGTKPSRTY